jgi:hypothetical protein
MIDLEMRNKLKEAGFPQGEPISLHIHLLAGGEFCNDPNCYMKDMFNPRLPNLSELIENCGDKFKLLVRFPNGGYGASSDDKCICEPTCYEDLSEGSTPEEAVANLFLSLTKLK